MAIILLIIAATLVAALGLHGYKQIERKRNERISQNEYDAAVTIWEYGRLVKEQIDETTRQGKNVLDFSRMTVPHSSGYKVSLELTGYNFRVQSVPERYNRTGRLSFYVDSALTVRAADHGGHPARAEDPEYKGDGSDLEQ